MSGNFEPGHAGDAGLRRRGRGRIWLVLIVTGVAAVIGMIWMLAASRAKDGVGAPQATSDAPAMHGMAGMQMGADRTVQLTANQISRFGITFGTAEIRTLENEVRAAGVVTFDETRIAQVTAKFAGFIERLYVNSTGQRVGRGEPLLDVFSPQLVAAQEELLIARQLEQTMNESAVPGVPAGSSNLLASARRRLKLWDISDAQIDAILRSGKVQRTLTLYSPTSGIAVEKTVVSGEAIQAGQPLFTIADLSRVWVEAELRESEAGTVRVGSAAEVELTAYAGRPYKGRVEYVYPTLQAESRTIKARIAVPNSDGRLKPGMYATVRITTPTRTVLTVPTSAVIRTGERSLVFVDMGGGQLMPHEVETGVSGTNHVEVLSGVDAGHRVVTSAQFLLESESNIGEVMKAMAGMGGDMDDMEGMDMSGGEMKGMDMPPGKGADVKEAMKNMSPRREAGPASKGPR